jgi:hypothetical protein
MLGEAQGERFFGVLNSAMKAEGKEFTRSNNMKVGQFLN